jgi:uncharacterized protein DUF4157
MNAAHQVQTRASTKPSLTPVGAGLLQRQCACGASTSFAEECDECESERLNLQRKAFSKARLSIVPAIVHDTLGASGQPLAPSTRTFMESRFGHDFSQVRVHTDARAAESARAVNARAYTVGRNVVFGTGQYAPEAAEGKRLLAHELAHVVQQSSATRFGSLEISDPAGGAEREAERAATWALAAGAETGQQTQAPLQVARQPDDAAPSPEPPATPTHVDIVRISCESNAIEFETDAGVRRYTLTDCDLDDGDYTAMVTVTDDDVDFDLGEAAPEGVRFRFSYRVDPGQPNPSTFFGGQTNVHIMTGTLAISPVTGPSPGPVPAPLTGGALVCSRPLDLPWWTGLRNFRHAFINDPPANYAIRDLLSGNGVTTSCTAKTDASGPPDDPAGGDTICKPCNAGPGRTLADLSRCLRATYAAYAQPNLYRNLPDPNDSWHHGPNSNSFAAAMAGCCVGFSPAGLGRLPGWNHRPAGPCRDAMSEQEEDDAPDAGPSDAGPSDAGPSDAEEPLPGGVPDAGSPDAGAPADAGGTAPVAACRPTLTSLTATKTDDIGMTTAWGSCQLRLGKNGGPGMTFKSVVDVPAGCTGTLQYVQLIDRCLQRRDASNTDERLKTGGYVLDTADPYPFGGSQRVTSPGTVNFQTDDSPNGGNAAGYVYRHGVDGFKMWLLWTPDAPVASPRVSLAMVEWDWTAKANKTGTTGGCVADWTVSDDSAHGGTGAATPTLPTWSQTYPTDFSYGPGIC